MTMKLFELLTLTCHICNNFYPHVNLTLSFLNKDKAYNTPDKPDKYIRSSHLIGLKQM